MVEASDLALFALLAEAGSFRKAAEQARMSTPGLSKRISRLESALATQLVFRNTRNMALTEAGRRLLTHASAVKQHQEAALAEVSSLSNSLRGQLVVSAPTISGDILLSDLVADFCTRYPEVRVDLRLDNRYVDLVRDGIDIAVRTGTLQDSSLRARWLIDSDWVVCTTPDYLSQHGSIVAPEQLQQHNCLIYALQDGGPRNWLFAREEGTYSVTVDGNLEANNAQVLKKAALRGLGVIYVPRCLVHRELDDGELLPLLTPHTAKSQGVYAITPFARHATPAVRCLIDEIASAYRAHAHWFCSAQK
uniref:LysR family transcriptional regulator n=1 Tax=Microbulbifer agarilyticus TaxID=260552 RepID=UPI0002559A8D|nr:LysR family transcriptional regulator [Microbulbifer agarilyticus]